MDAVKHKRLFVKEDVWANEVDFLVAKDKARFGLLVMVLLLMFLIIGVFTLLSGFGISLREWTGKAEKKMTEESTVAISAEAVPKAASKKVQGILVSDGKEVKAGNGVKIDLSAKEQGYFRVCYSGDYSNVRVQVLKRGTDSYHVYPPDRKWHGYPINSGPGQYEIAVIANDDASNQYDKIFTTTATFAFSEADPFRYANTYVYFDADSPLCEKAQELTRDEESDRKKVEKVITWAKWYVDYDNVKAERVKDGEVDPVSGISKPDEVFREANGICNDQAALTAAMLRSIGLSVKMAYGKEIDYKKGADEIYHAWIYVYLDGKWAMYDPSYGAEEIIANQIPKKVTYMTPLEIH